MDAPAVLPLIAWVTMYAIQVSSTNSDQGHCIICMAKGKNYSWKSLFSCVDEIGAHINLHRDDYELKSPGAVTGVIVGQTFPPPSGGRR